MISTGQYAETLRAMGRFLESARASEIIIVDQGELVEVSWRGRRGSREERQYRAWELDALRTWAKMFRGLEGGNPRFNLSEALRTLGRELDVIGIESVTIVETADGFWASGKIDGADVRQSYTNADLMAKSHAFNQSRTPERARS
ncbi:MAG TPA: hypothetical protein VFC51_16425 [Chloroflexota bacterium]|nr:hypothetical protein [Chloroflexota bacterium]